MNSTILITVDQPAQMVSITIPADTREKWIEGLRSAEPNEDRTITIFVTGDQIVFKDIHDGG